VSGADRAIGALIIGSEILTGKRQDKHLQRVIERLATRGLTLAYAHYLGDDRARLTALLRETFAQGDIVFSFGGIGATPDDHTRQAAAAASGCRSCDTPKPWPRSRRASAPRPIPIAC